MSNMTTLPEEMTPEQAVQFLNSNSTSITIDCDFGGRIAPFPVYVGDPKDDSHPLHHQATWLQSERGGTIPGDVMESFSTLQKIARENKVSLQMLCLYAFGEAQNKPVDANGDSGGDSAYLSPPETPEVIRQDTPEPETQSSYQSQADADAAAVMAAASPYQQRVEQSRPDENTPENPYKQS